MCMICDGKGNVHMQNKVDHPRPGTDGIFQPAMLKRVDTSERLCCQVLKHFGNIEKAPSRDYSQDGAFLFCIRFYTLRQSRR